jgi:hypothetical protein
MKSPISLAASAARTSITGGGQTSKPKRYKRLEAEGVIAFRKP